MTLKALSIEEIRIDGGTQARVSLCESTVAEYAEAIEDGARMPPIEVYFDGAAYWLADGFHRFFANKKAGKAKIDATVYLGQRRDAILFSLNANARHGLRRSNADKRKAVETLLGDEEWSQWSDRQIAKACGVSNTLVSNLRISLSTVDSDLQKDTCKASHESDKSTRNYVNKDGKTVTMDTSNIGKKADAESAAAPPAPAPAPAPAPGPVAPPAQEPAAAPAVQPTTAETPSVTAQPIQQSADSSVTQADDQELEDDDSEGMLSNEEVVTEMAAEIEKLQADIKALTATDKDAEILKWRKLVELADRRRDELMQVAATRQRHTDFVSRQLMRCGRAVNVDDTDKIAPAVEKLARDASKTGIRP